MRFHTALRQGVRAALERHGSADIVVGIPCFNNESTLAHVVRTAERGLALHYPDRRGVVFIADGGSLDDTREAAEGVEPNPGVERFVAIYRGVPGKGSAVRAIFEAAAALGARACLLFDSDLRSISPDWVKCVADPILSDGVDFVAPYYTRYKYDGTITNNIVYNLTRALYGYRVRQPIGGDFGFSLAMVQKYLPKKDWESDVARFGIDIWLTTTAMVERAKMAQANLGVKIHDVKDPAEALGPMFQQVVTTLLLLAEEHEAVWKRVTGSQKVPIVGLPQNVEPEAFPINLSKLVDDFKAGFERCKETWARILSGQSWRVVQDLAAKEQQDFALGPENWARILYDLVAAFHHWKGDRRSLVGMMTPLYFARVASFANQTRHMSNAEAETVVEEQAEVFESMKDYLVRRWDELGKD